MITDLIKFVIKPEYIGEAIDLFKEQLNKTRDEEGCISDNLFQLREDPATLYLLIRWKDEESLKKHMEQPYDLEFRNKMDRLLAGPVEPVDWRQII